ncbi:hypothetical protein HWV62_8881 [Athelia sp. TMB]|nr:hypothetical protein HWV62_8881 [Athelia sp. TMB]
MSVLTDKRLALEDIEGEFAMSTTINLHPTTLQAVRHTLSYHRHSISASASLHVPQDSSPVSPIISAELLKSLSALASPSPAFGVAHRTNIHPTLSLYISDLFSATRHHPQLDAMLLTARARKDTDALVRAARVIGGDPTGTEFISIMGKGAEAKARGEPPFVETYAYGAGYEDSLSADMDWEHVNGHDSMNRSQLSAVFSEATSEELTLDASEADIARIVPRVLSHRLRVRDGPEHEILGSLRYGVVDICSDWERGDKVTDSEGGIERDTVKNILVKILSEV